MRSLLCLSSFALLACGGGDAPVHAPTIETKPAATIDVAAAGTHGNASDGENANPRTGLPTRKDNDPPPSAREVAKVTPLRLPAPPFAATVRRSVPTGGSAAPTLKQASATKNKITDEEEWMRKNMTAPARSSGDAVSLQGDRVVLVTKSDGTVVSAFDFTAFVEPTSFVKGEGDFVHGQVTSVALENGVLYVSTSHRTYASSTYGKNAFISALDAKSGELLWQSAPLVSNALNFLVHGDHIFSGYGFTKEPDFVFVLDRANGSIVTKIPVASGPEHLVEKNNQLLVRTYDTDYVFDIR